MQKFITVIGRLRYNEQYVGFRTLFRGKMYDVSIEDYDLIVEDFDLSKDYATNITVINLVENGNLLVPENAPNVEELTYGSFATLIGHEHLAKMDTDLKRDYNRYNKEIFGNRLPKLVLVYWTNKMTAGAGVCRQVRNRHVPWGYDFSIGMSVPYHQKYPNEIKDTLVHEMIHVLYPNEHHGYAFKSEMSRINRQHNMNITVRATGRATEKKYNYLYVCRECGCEYKRVKRHKNDYKFATCGVARCKGSIYLKEHGIDDHFDDETDWGAGTDW